MSNDDFAASEKAIRMSYREAQILRFVRSHVRDFGRAPYQHEIAAHLRIKARSHVGRMLAKMVEKGVVIRDKHQKGWIRLPDQEEVPALFKKLPREVSSVIETMARMEKATIASIMTDWLIERAALETKRKAAA